MAESLSSRMARVIFQDYIECGMVGAGQALPSIRELKQLYGASVTTIAHALGQLEIMGYVQKIQGKGCYVKVDLRNDMPKSQHRTIGFICPSVITSEPMAHLQEGIQRRASKLDCRVYQGTFTGTCEQEREQVMRMIDDGCDAIILNPCPRFYDQVEDDYLINELQDFPIVLVDMALPEHKRIQILFDNRTLGYQMTDMLLQEGHYNIAFAHPLFKGREVIHRSISDRRRGYLNALRKVNIIPRPIDNWTIHVSGPPLDELGNPVPEVFDLVEKIKVQADRATAVIAYSDVLAVGIMMAANTHDIKIPEELRVVGFDNLTPGQLARPAFPTSNPDFTYAGEMAVELVNRWLDGEIFPPMTYMLPVPILRRTSEVMGVATLL